MNDLLKSNARVFRVELINSTKSKAFIVADSIEAAYLIAKREFKTELKGIFLEYENVRLLKPKELKNPTLYEVSYKREIGEYEMEFDSITLITSEFDSIFDVIKEIDPKLNITGVGEIYKIDYIQSGFY